MWEYKMLKELGSIITGNTPPTHNRDYYGDKYKFIKPTDMTEGLRYVCQTEEMLSDFGYERYKKSIIPENTPCVVTIGSLGKKMCLTNEPSFTNQAVNAIVPNDENDGRFIYFLMKLMLPTVKHLSSGTASGRENVSKSSFANIKVKVSPLRTQQKIADILSTYDDLIENNNHRIELLEQAAQQLYKEWFVRFRFPSYEAAHFTKGIPDGWEVKKFGEIVVIIDGDRGTNYPKQNEMLDEGYCLFLNAGNVTINGFDFSKNTFITKEKDEQLRKGKLNRNDIVITTRGTVGNVALYNRFVSFKEIRINSGMVIIRPVTSSTNTTFLYLLLRSSYVQQLISLFASGSAQPQLPIKDMKNMKVLVPSRTLITEFEDIVKPILEIIANKVNKNQNLIKQRDLLLPRLMSGKIEV